MIPSTVCATKNKFASSTVCDRIVAERKSSWPGFGSYRSSTVRHPSQSLRSLFCKQKKIYERQARLAISKRLISGLLAENSQSENRRGPASSATADYAAAVFPVAVFVLRSSPRQAGSLVDPFAAQLACRGEISALPR